MKKYFKISFLGILSWLIPLIVSLFFYSQDGKLSIDSYLFKSLMIVVGGVCGASLLVYYFKTIKSRYISEGIVIGLIWLVINVVFDLITIVPMSKMTIVDYCYQIGLRYLLIPIMSVSMGYIATNVKQD
ncbi:MAG: hypothetical protein H6Q73_562 [Firmicutes bacterium]|nr:hypothetical protein [Bacillota bacterium]